MANPTTVSLGLGTLTIDGRNVGILVGDVAFSQEFDTIDYETGTPLVASASLVVRAKARLTATAAELSNEALSLLFRGLTSQVAAHAVTFTHPRPAGDEVVVSFPSATISTRGSIKFSPNTFTVADIEIESMGALPSINISGAVTPTHTVTYNANGGSGGPAGPASFQAGESVTVQLAAPPTRSGFTFAGWATSAGASSPVYASGGTTSFTMPAENVTLYAVWQPEVVTYTLVYSPNGGAGGPSSSAHAEGATVNVAFTPAPTKDGVTFAGWAFQVDAASPQFAPGGATTFTMPATSLVLYAVYALEQT